LRGTPIHVGRVNHERELWQCDLAGATSVDGTGFVRNERGRNHVRAYLAKRYGAERRGIQLGLLPGCDSPILGRI